MFRKCACLFAILLILNNSEAKSLGNSNEVLNSGTTICPENITTNNENLTESLDENNDAATTTVSPELENPITNTEDLSELLPPKTIAEELENTVDDFKEVFTEEQVFDTTTMDYDSKEERFDSIINDEMNNEKTTENLEETTTLCSEELKQLSVKNILSIQKNSALYKLVKDKLNLRRSKRQVQYYANQPSSSYQPQKTYNKAKTYQQIQRQYQKNAKPVKRYYNPTSYARYPSNNRISYYRTRGVNRRQFQGVTSTTSRATRAAIKKKFRPSPVFP